MKLPKLSSGDSTDGTTHKRLTCHQPVHTYTIKRNSDGTALWMDGWHKAGKCIRKPSGIVLTAADWVSAGLLSLFKKCGMCHGTCGLTATEFFIIPCNPKTISWRNTSMTTSIQFMPSEHKCCQETPLVCSAIWKIKHFSYHSRPNSNGSSQWKLLWTGRSDMNMGNT